VKTEKLVRFIASGIAPKQRVHLTAFYRMGSIYILGTESKFRREVSAAMHCFDTHTCEWSAIQALDDLDEENIPPNNNNTCDV
jgi:hypothetical protein